MRNVLKNHNEVCHYWANKIQSHGRASNMFFEGDSIYSYGYHFKIAMFVKPNVILYTTAGYSPSTGKHKSYVSRAIPDTVKVFTVPSFTDHKYNLDYFIKSINERFEQAARSRKYTTQILSGIVSDAAVVRDYVNEFKLKLTKEQLAVVRSAEICLNEDQLAEVKTKLAERTKKIIEENKEAIQQWINCERRSIPDSVTKIFLRTACSDSTKVETSLGAYVTIREAKGLYLAIKKNKPVHGFSIGGYTVTSYSDGVLKVGCHKITDDEINRFATLQGWN